MARETVLRKALERAEGKASARRPLTPPVPRLVDRVLRSRTLLLVAFAFVAGSLVTARVVHDADEVRIRKAMTRVSRNAASCVSSGRRLDFSEAAPLCVDPDGSRSSTADIAIPPASTPVDLAGLAAAASRSEPFKLLPRDAAGRVVAPAAPSFGGASGPLSPSGTRRG